MFLEYCWLQNPGLSLPLQVATKEDGGNVDPCPSPEVELSPLSVSCWRGLIGAFAFTSKQLLQLRPVNGPAVPFGHLCQTLQGGQVAGALSLSIAIWTSSSRAVSRL